MSNDWWIGFFTMWMLMFGSISWYKLIIKKDDSYTNLFYMFLTTISFVILLLLGGK